MRRGRFAGDVVERLRRADAHELRRVDTADGRPHRRRQGRRLAGGRAHQQEGVVEPGLGHRHVHLHEVLGLVGPALHLARHADDLANHRRLLRRVGRRQRDAVADRVAATEVPPHERLVHDADERALPQIGRRERTAGHDRQIDRVEVGVAHDLVVRQRPLAVVGRRVADDRDGPLAGVRGAERRRARPGHAADAGHRRDLARHLVVELLQRFVGGIARRQRVDHHRQDLVGAIAAIDVLHREQRAQQQAGADQQQHRSGHFGHHQHAAQPAAAAGGRAGVGGDGPRRRQVADLPRRGDAEEHADEQRRSGAEQSPPGRRRSRRPRPAAGPAGISRRRRRQDGRADAGAQDAAESSPAPGSR